MLIVSYVQDYVSCFWNILIMWYRNSGVTILYNFNDEKKSLIEHLEDLFPNLNSVEIFYLMNRVKKRAKKLGVSVEDVLYDIAFDGLFRDGR